MTSPPALAEFFDREVFPRLAVETAYREVPFTATSGRYWRGLCPFAPHEMHGEIRVDVETLRWSCPEHCGCIGQSVLAYFNGGRFPQPGSGEFRAAIDSAIALVRVSMPNLPNPTFDEEYALAHQERVASLLEIFFDLARDCLLDAAFPGTRTAHEFLASQGFDLSQLPDLPIGLFPGPERARQHLEQSGYLPQEIDASELVADARLIGRILGPIRDFRGKIVSFWARHPKDYPPRFLFKGRWKEAVGLAGLDVALLPSAGGREHLVLVERLLDAILCQAQGMGNVAAIAGPADDLTSRRWQCLKGLGVERVTLALDLSGEGAMDELLHAVHEAFQDEPSPDIYILPNGNAANPTRRRETLRELGDFALEELGEAAIPIYTAKATEILRRHIGGENWTDATRHAAWKEGIEFYISAGRSHSTRLDEQFVPVIVGGLGRTWDTFQPCPGFVERDFAEDSSLTDDLSDGQEPNVDFNRAAEVVHARPSPLLDPRRLPVFPAIPTGYCTLHHCSQTVCFCFD